MMTDVLYMPDGNRRFAERENISLDNAYYLGGKTLKLLTNFFIISGKSDCLIYHAMSDYTHERRDGTLTSIYEAAEKTLTELSEEKFFKENEINLQIIDHTGKFSQSLRKFNEPNNNTKNTKKVMLLLGYSAEEDYNQALKNKPENYKELRKYLLFPEIDLVLRNKEMRPSGGPVYAMLQAQMITIDKLNPEVSINNLENVWLNYQKLLARRKSRNPSSINQNHLYSDIG